MKPVISIAALSALGFIACQQSSPSQSTPPASTAKEIPARPTEDDATDAVADARALQIALAPYESPTQHIQVMLDKPKDITGAKGTVVHLDPADLETEDGSPAGKNVELVLTELTDKEEMLRSHTQTESNGKPLVSGGAYYIGCTANGHRLRLKPGKTMAVSFPRKSSEGMQLYYGNRDSVGNMNWQAAGKALKASRKTDSVTEKIAVVQERDSIVNANDYDRDAAFGVRVENGQAVREPPRTKRIRDTQYVTRKIDVGKKLQEQLYAQVQVDKMGWFNCDRPYETPGTTELLVKAPPAYKGRLVRFFIVFKKRNSLLSRQFYPRGDESSTLYGLPENEPVRIIAFTVAGGLHAFSQDVVLHNTAINLDLQPATDAAIRQLMHIPARG